MHFSMNKFFIQKSHMLRTYSKPLVLAACLAANPGLFEVSRQEYTGTGTAYPCDYHEGSMQSEQQV